MKYFVEVFKGFRISKYIFQIENLLFIKNWAQ